MFKLSTQLSHYHRHILRRTAPSGVRIFSTAPRGTPRSTPEEADRKTPGKDDINPTSEGNARSGINDEVADINAAADQQRKIRYFNHNFEDRRQEGTRPRVINPAQERATAEAEGKTKPIRIFTG